MPNYDVLGIASILPLDLNFLLATNQSLAQAERQAKAAEPNSAINGGVPFNVVSFHRSGGGKIANIASFLGSAGHKVAVCGVVGGDMVGKCVMEDLLDHGVVTKHVSTSASANTRVIFLLRPRNLAKSKQVPLTNPPRVCYSPSLLEGLPPSKIVLLGRANKSVLEFARKARKEMGAKVAFHLASIPWRKAERSVLRKALKLSDLLVIDASLREEFFSLLHVTRRTPLKLCDKLAAALIVFYGGINAVKAIHNPVQKTTRQFVEPDSCEPLPTEDQTGIFDCFHAAMLSFWLKSGLLLTNVKSVRAALGYANEVASRSASGIGARSFPSLLEQDRIGAKYLREYRYPYDVAISFMRADRKVAEWLAFELQRSGARVFYDKFLQARLAGEKLKENLTFRNWARFAVPLTSRNYLKSPWTRIELRAMRAKVRRQQEPYVIPVKLDSTNVRGIPAGIGYLEIGRGRKRESDLGQVVRFILEKLAPPR